MDAVVVRVGPVLLRLVFLHRGPRGPGGALLALHGEDAHLLMQVLLVPSAFAMRTGEAHWETLLRCRAIETQCYVFAAAQVGQFPARSQDPGNR